MHEFIDNISVDPSGQTILTSLIDADSISYIIGWEYKDSEDVDGVMQAVDQFISQMLVQLQTRQYAGYFSPKKCFRHGLFPEYKAKRKPPHEGIQKWKPTIEAWCKEKWGFGEWPNHEADDAVSVMQQNMLNSTICSPDKDLRQVPGNNFDYKKGLRTYITEEEAYYNLCYQLLVGDGVDNIPGCRGIGEKTAKQILAHTPLIPGAYMSLVLATYVQVYGILEGPTRLTEQMSIIRTRSTEDGGNHLRQFLHTFDLDAAGTSSYLVPSDKANDAAKLFGEW